MKIAFTSVYRIGEKVYHITPESDLGTVINVRYWHSTGYVEYLVTFSKEMSDWYGEHELSTVKTF